jgi:polysaccharide biosynthesis/export protein
MKPRLPFYCLLAGLLAGGALGLPNRLAGADAVSTPATPAPAPTARKSGKALYTLTLTDRIHLEVVNEAELTATQRVDGHGNVNLVYIGEVHVAGLTLAAAQDAVEKAYVDEKYLKHPQVTISVDEYAARTVSIQGAVKNPGRFELPPEATMSVVELVTKAGGFTDIGKGSDVRITHASGGNQVEHVDVQGIITGKSKLKPDDESLLLLPGDIVYVPEKII